MTLATCRRVVNVGAMLPRPLLRAGWPAATRRIYGRGARPRSSSLGDDCREQGLAVEDEVLAGRDAGHAPARESFHFPTSLECRHTEGDRVGRVARRATEAVAQRKPPWKVSLGDTFLGAVRMQLGGVNASTGW